MDIDKCDKKYNSIGGNMMCLENTDNYTGEKEDSNLQKRILNFAKKSVGTEAGVIEQSEKNTQTDDQWVDRFEYSLLNMEHSAINNKMSMKNCGGAANEKRMTFNKKKIETESTDGLQSYRNFIKNENMLDVVKVDNSCQDDDTTSLLLNQNDYMQS